MIPRLLLSGWKYPREFFIKSIPNIISSSITSNESFQSRSLVSKSDPESIEYKTLVEEVESKNVKIENLEIDLQAKDSEVEELLDGILQVHNKNNSLKVGYPDRSIELNFYLCFYHFFVLVLWKLKEPKLKIIA